ncbi:MAG: hypothetical protein JWO82_2078, partial [Akkermansiaceae bacterium]|nr:hypothetical protein [Akkermansiaceae bacterium]
MGSKKGKKKPGAASAKPIKKAPARAVEEPSVAEPEASHVIPAAEAGAGMAFVESAGAAAVPFQTDGQTVPATAPGEEIPVSETEWQELESPSAGEEPADDIFSEPESEAGREPLPLEDAAGVSVAAGHEASAAVEESAEAFPIAPGEEAFRDEPVHETAVEALPAYQPLSEADDEEIPRLLKPDDDDEEDRDDLEDWPEAAGEQQGEEEMPKLVPRSASDRDEDERDGPWSPDFPRRSEGMKVRVIGGGSPKSPVTPARASQRKGLEIGFRIGAQKKVAGTAAWDAEESQEEVLRLEAPVEAELPTRLQPMEASEVPVPFSALPRPKQKKKLTMRQWTICMAAGTVVLVVGIVFLTQLAGRKKPVNAAESQQKLEIEKVVLDQSESADFVRNITGLNAEAEASLKRFAAATTIEQALKEVREPERVRARFVNAWRPWPKPAFAKGDDFDAMLMEGQGKTALGLGGYRGDYTHFLMLFVKMDGKMKLDWEASFGISDIDIAEMPEKAGSAPLVVRATIKKEAYYTPAFPETEYAAYELFDLTRDNHIWGYVPLKSKAAETLADLLN